MEVRRYASGREAIRIHFSYRGVECRETLKGVRPTAANCKFAERLIATIQHEIAIGTFDYLARFPDSKKARLLSRVASRATLKSIRKAYEDDARRRLQPATVKGYLGALNTWVMPTFGNVPMSEIDAPMIRREIRALAERDLATKSISNYKTALNKILDFAVDEGYLEQNPALSVKVGTIVPRKGTRDKVDPLGQDEISKILAVAGAKFSTEFSAYLAFAFYSGLRTSELYGLRWDDVDWMRGTVFVQRAIVHGKLKDTPKTDAGLREVLLLPPALAALKSQRAATQLLGAWIWINPVTGTHFRRYKETAGRFRRAEDPPPVVGDDLV